MITPFPRSDQRYQQARNQVKIFRGPRGTVYSCPFCKHFEMTRRGPGQGRGHGLRTGGAAHSRVSAHIASTHSTEE